MFTAEGAPGFLGGQVLPMVGERELEARGGTPEPRPQPSRQPASRGSCWVSLFVGRSASVDAVDGECPAPRVELPRLGIRDRGGEWLGEL